MTLPPWVPFMSALLCFELAGDIFAKEFALYGGMWRMALAAGLVLVGNICWQLMLRAGMDLSRGGIIFAVGVAIGVVAIGVLGYREPITKRQLLGVAFGIAAVELLAG